MTALVCKKSSCEVISHFCTAVFNMCYISVITLVIAINNVLKKKTKKKTGSIFGLISITLYKRDVEKDIKHKIGSTGRGSF